jgi:hypothetical protein
VVVVVVVVVLFLINPGVNLLYM